MRHRGVSGRFRICFTPTAIATHKIEIAATTITMEIIRRATPISSSDG